MKKLKRLLERLIVPHGTWSQPYDIQALRRRLAAFSPDDPLYPLLIGFLDASVVRLADTTVSGEGAQQLVGRLNMVADLRSDLQRLWRESHEKV